MSWRPDPILRALLGWTALSTLIFWLPFVRGLFDGETYEWGLAGMGGTGVSGDFWMPVLGVAFARLLHSREEREHPGERWNPRGGRRSLKRLLESSSAPQTFAALHRIFQRLSETRNGLVVSCSAS